MGTRGFFWFLFLSIAAWPAGKDKEKFRVQPAASYPSRQTSQGLTIAAVPFTRAEQAKQAFGKVNPYELGVLPVLIVMQNDSNVALRLDRMEMYYVDGNRHRVIATPASEVPYLEGPQRPNFGGGPFPNPLPRRPKKNKLAIPEIEGLALNAKILPPHDSAHGFVYFQTGHRSGAHIYIRGIYEAATGTELLYFEIPLD